MRPVDAETSSPVLPRSGVRLGVETEGVPAGGPATAGPDDSYVLRRAGSCTALRPGSEQHGSGPAVKPALGRASSPCAQPQPESRTERTRMAGVYPQHAGHGKRLRSAGKLCTHQCQLALAVLQRCGRVRVAACMRWVTAVVGGL
jgi:hypothetical protein